MGQIEPIKITSNPKFWSAEDVYKYLINDLFCKDVGLKLFNEVKIILNNTYQHLLVNLIYCNFQSNVLGS